MDTSRPRACPACVQPQQLFLMPCHCHAELQVHAAIRANPVQPKKARSKPADAKKWQPRKSTYEERKERLKQKLATLMEADDE